MLISSEVYEVHIANANAALDAFDAGVISGDIERAVHAAAAVRRAMSVIRRLEGRSDYHEAIKELRIRGHLLAGRATLLRWIWSSPSTKATRELERAAVVRGALWRIADAMDDIEEPPN